MKITKEELTAIIVFIVCFLIVVIITVATANHISNTVEKNGGLRNVIVKTGVEIKNIYKEIENSK